MPATRPAGLVEARDHELLVRAAVAPPRGEHAVEALLLRVGAVGDRGEVALRRRAATARPGRARSTGAACGRGASARPPSLHGTSSGARGEAARLDRALPDAVAAGAVAGGGGVEADRARHGRRAARPWCSSRATARGAKAAIASRAARRAFSAQASSIAANVRQLARAGHGGELHPRAGAAQRGGELGVGLAQSGGAAEGDDQHVGARHRPGILAAHERRPSCPSGSRSAGCAASDRVPSWALELHEGFVSITRTPDELSIVCPEEAVPPDTRSRRLARAEGAGADPVRPDRRARVARRPAGRGGHLHLRRSPPTTPTTCWSRGRALERALRGAGDAGGAR